jgi:hypothetical protein
MKTGRYQYGRAPGLNYKRNFLTEPLTFSLSHFLTFSPLTDWSPGLSRRWMF